MDLLKFLPSSAGTTGSASSELGARSGQGGGAAKLGKNGAPVAFASLMPGAESTARALVAAGTAAATTAATAAAAAAAQPTGLATPAAAADDAPTEPAEPTVADPLTSAPFNSASQTSSSSSFRSAAVGGARPPGALGTVRAQASVQDRAQARVQTGVQTQTRSSPARPSSGPPTGEVPLHLINSSLSGTIATKSPEASATPSASAVALPVVAPTPVVPILTPGTPSAPTPSVTLASDTAPTTGVSPRASLAPEFAAFSPLSSSALAASSLPAGAGEPSQAVSSSVTAPAAAAPSTLPPRGGATARRAAIQSADTPAAAGVPNPLPARVAIAGAAGAANSSSSTGIERSGTLSSVSSLSADGQRNAVRRSATSGTSAGETTADQAGAGLPADSDSLGGVGSLPGAGPSGPLGMTAAFSDAESLNALGTTRSTTAASLTSASDAAPVSTSSSGCRTDRQRGDLNRPPAALLSLVIRPELFHCGGIPRAARRVPPCDLIFRSFGGCRSGINFRDKFGTGSRASRRRGGREKLWGKYCRAFRAGSTSGS